MALIRWEPSRELRSARNDFDRLFNSVFDTSTFAVTRPAPRPFAPALDIVEAESEYVITMDLPGLEERDIAVQVQDGILSISGERTREAEQTAAGYRRIERSAGQFRRSLALPEGIDPAAITASFERGVLELHVPKPQARTPHTVQIAVTPGREALGESTEAASEPAGDAVTD